MSTRRIAAAGFLVGLLSLLAVGCGRGPREGDYDRDHHRYYHERAWHDCADRDEHCR
jgi:hypothetical protein